MSRCCVHQAYITLGAQNPHGQRNNDEKSNAKDQCNLTWKIDTVLK